MPLITEEQRIHWMTKGWVILNQTLDASVRALVPSWVDDLVVMQLLRKAAVATLFSTVAWAIPAQAVEIEVAYPYSHLIKDSDFWVQVRMTQREFSSRFAVPDSRP